MAFNWKFNTSHLSELRCMASDSDSHSVRRNLPVCGVDSDDFAVANIHTRTFTVLDDVDSQSIGCSRISPCDSIVTCDTTARFQESSLYWVPGVRSTVQ